MSLLVQSWLRVFSIVVALVGAIVYQTHYVDKRIDDLRALIDSRFSEFDSRFSDLKDFIRSEIRRVEDRIERLEHPVVR